MPAGAAVGDAITACTQRAMHDALDAGPVQGDEHRWADGRMGGWAEQMPHAAEVPRSFLTHGRGQQDRSPGVYPRSNERFADRDERGETARIIGDAWALQPGPAARHGHVQFRTEHGVQMGGYDDASVV